MVLHFHLSDVAVFTGSGLVRPEHGDALSLGQLAAFLRDTGAPVTVRPVRDPHTEAAVDANETPLRLRDLLLVRHPVEVFPYGTCTSRSMDLDHSIAYLDPDEGGPPGQTGMHGLGPFGRSHHRAVTHGRWGRRQPDPGTYAFRSPHGWVYLVTNQGTLALGNTDYAHAVWDAAG